MSNKSIWSFVALASAGVAACSAANAATFPSVGANPLGPEFIITENSNGSFTTAVNPAYSSDPGPYDSVEDTYFGVINNSSSVLHSITVSAPNGPFGFDGDGIDTFGVTGSDPTGYGGPDATFTNISLDLDTGTVVFGPNGIAPGGSDIFSLEEAIALNTIVVTRGVPEPSTWAMMLLGFVGLGFLARRRKSRTTEQQFA
jgi:PEP-CTERM motif